MPPPTRSGDCGRRGDRPPVLGRRGAALRAPAAANQPSVLVRRRRRQQSLRLSSPILSPTVSPPHALLPCPLCPPCPPTSGPTASSGLWKAPRLSPSAFSRCGWSSPKGCSAASVRTGSSHVRPGPPLRQRPLELPLVLSCREGDARAARRKEEKGGLACSRLSPPTAAANVFISLYFAPMLCRRCAAGVCAVHGCERAQCAPR